MAVREPAAVPMSRGDVFLIDDDAHTAALLLKVLAREGYRAEACTEPEHALDKDLSFLPEVILLDIMMPGVSGLDLARALKQGFQNHPIRIVMLTARTEAEFVEQAARAGADDYLTKPIKRRELIGRLDRQVRALRAERAIGRIRSVLLEGGEPSAQLEAVLGALREMRVIQ